MTSIYNGANLVPDVSFDFALEDLSSIAES